MSAAVYITHCIDTEGPLYESLEAKFERLREIHGIDHVATSQENLDLLRRGEICLDGKEVEVQKTLASHRTTTFGTWDQVDEMLDEVMAMAFREQLLDSNGRGWVYNWFCLDHIGFMVNPRRRDIGFANVFDHYQARLARLGEVRDEVHWHFHPMSTYEEAHRCATHYLRTDHIYQILCRRILDRGWFPSAFRAGFQAERPDSHWFLEQYIPFDMTNMALDDPSEFDRAADFRKGRSGDWRRAPADWSVYHPSHDDYQVPGQCRRWIGRCLNIMSRIASIDQSEMDKAFARAADGAATIVGVCSHDFRHLSPEVEFVRELIRTSQKKYPGVEIRFAGVLEAFREALVLDEQPRLKLTIEVDPEGKGDVPSITVRSVSGRVFGPQPFLAIRTRGGRYIHDNLDFSSKDQVWYYAFHGDTLDLNDVHSIGVGASDARGETSVAVKVRDESGTFTTSS